MNKIYIVDAVNYLFRAYYAIGPMTNDHGQSTSALYGFIRSIQKLIKEFSPAYLVCVFDGPDNKKSRQAVYSEYKAHRKGAPEDLFPQFELAEQWCAMAGIPTLCVEGVEADDTMATIAHWAREHKAKSYLCSSDKDLLQLVDNHIFVLYAHKENLLVDAAKVKELFGVHPKQMLDYLAIVGDASDNIPGLEGFGPKTTAALLEEFGTLDNLLAHPEKVKGEKKQEMLRTKQDLALMSRELATLNTKVPIPHESAFYRVKEQDTGKLSQFFHEMKFLSLLRELAPSSPPTAEKKKGKRHTEKRCYHFVNDEWTLTELLKRLSLASQVCIDTETTGLDPMTAEWVGIGFCIEPGEAWYVPRNGNLPEKETLTALKHFFASAQCAFYGHNIKYDLHILENLGIVLHNICFDTLIASYLLNPQIRRHNLDDLSLEHFQKVKIPIESLIGKGKNQISMLEVPPEQVAKYCCEDVDYTARLKELFEELLKERRLESLFTEIEIPLIAVLENMERTGIYLDVQKIENLGRHTNKELDSLKRKIYKEAQEEFNLNSPKQLSHILFSQLHLQPPARKKTEFATGADVLESLMDAHPIIPLILQYRLLEKLRSTYIEALPEAVNPKTHRIHCTFNQSVAATGRLSSQDPNLQNIPIRTQEGLAIRACFEPKSAEWSFLGGDYSQIELRLLAHFSQDPELLRAFRSSQDIHVHTASLIYDIPAAMITPEMRNLAKTVNFAILYGQGPFGLSKQLHISTREASTFIDTYFKRYPKIRDYLDSCKEAAQKTGVATTLTGRQRPIPEINNKNPAVRAAAERLAINTPLQGTAADLIKKAMIEIDREIKNRRLEGKMILQIHDELIFEIPDAEIATFKKLVKHHMEQVFPLNVPIEVHISVGKNWAEC
ncbi:MAG: DNA polymerase I [Chlamydiia bacterium]|nr:DNA polymerase I [Chlamydiia bacterium]